MVQPCGANGLAAWDQVSCYCERALNPDFWGEPLNAMSNLAFLFAAVFAYADYRARGEARGGPAIIGLVALMMLVGTGSFLFHTYATVWSRLADVVPIAVFVAAYMVLALRWFGNMRLWGALNVSAIVVLGTLAMFLCGGLLPDNICAALRGSLNGSLAYAPALVALGVVGVTLTVRGHGAAGWILAAFAVFAVSLAFRTLDGWPADAPLGCMVREAGKRTVALGTHSLWHVLNAVMLYLLLRAAIENRPGKSSV